ncbi:hypothetical protein [Pseudonocardia acidicola]|uniref:Uncharacterized protein n=1 Tax=Pseudonocardia acidicola TaxID=2724939 RepID=A0ABX1S8Z3_9PSEU|nr:hypothetical protein [Pseudonocardia acidicola]NMH97352.1 hypothetical protein [Pseudonocardia acidicola]
MYGQVVIETEWAGLRRPLLEIERLNIAGRGIEITQDAYDAAGRYAE